MVTSYRITVQRPYQDADSETTHMPLSLPHELCSLECVCSVLPQAVPCVGSHIFHHSQDSELFQPLYNHSHPAPSPPSHPRPYFWTDTTVRHFYNVVLSGEPYTTSKWDPTTWNLLGLAFIRSA